MAAATSAKSAKASKPKPKPPVEYSILYTATLCLLAGGAVMVYSASSAESLVSQGDAAYYLKRYVMLGAVGLLAMHVISKYDLRTLKSFQVKATISRESVLLDGQKVQFDGKADLIVQRPNHLRLEMSSDRSERRFFFDGKNFTLVAPRTNYYATVAAPPTIAQLADTLETRFGIALPLVDLFRWGTPDGIDGNLTSANYVGPSQIEGVTCEQYAFRQDGADWQVWIQSGDFKLPRKVVITTTTDEARPQYSAVYTWNLAPSFDDAAFSFAPDKDDHRIVLADALAANKAGSK